MRIQAEPGSLRAAASRFADEAAQLRHRGTRMEEIKNQMLMGAHHWQGVGADAYRSHTELLNRELQKMAHVLEDASSVLNQFAGRMERVNELRRQADSLESSLWGYGGDPDQESERRYHVMQQVNALRQEAEWEANSADATASSGFSQLIPDIALVMELLQPSSGTGDMLDGLPPVVQAYYRRHPELIEEEKKKRHLFVVGGIAPSKDPYDLAIANLAERLVEEDQADSYTIVDEFTPNEIYEGIFEVAKEKVWIDNHRSTDLKEEIRQYHTEHPDEEIDIIAHSGGGEVSRDAQNDLYEEGNGDVVNKIISFGGADWTDPENKRIYHITSPIDIVGAPGPQVGLELTGLRAGEVQKVELEDDRFITHVNPGIGDHVNYFTPGDNLEKSYGKVTKVLDLADNLDLKPPKNSEPEVKGENDEDTTSDSDTVSWGN